MPHEDDPHFPRMEGESDEAYEDRLIGELAEEPKIKIKYKGRNAILRELPHSFDVYYDRTFSDDPVAELPKKWNEASKRYEPVLEKRKFIIRRDKMLARKAEEEAAAAERKRLFKERLTSKKAAADLKAPTFAIPEPESGSSSEDEMPTTEPSVVPVVLRKFRISHPQTHMIGGYKGEMAVNAFRDQFREMMASMSHRGPGFL